ncbi:GAF domain-containing protein [Rhodopila globiformis]|uniref:GAF domain-containing protein n=1 Tax=Rhodopila globiformis TaxID=1071 RepID=UPI001EFDE44C|nr:GAF domain-containing protein [Rhodopila globiformis]
MLDDAADRDAVAGSWRRCLTRHNLDPERECSPIVLCNAELREVRARTGRILRVADPELDRLHGLVAALGYSVLMTDAQGVVIARRVADSDESACRHWRLWTGAVWDEAIEGTNGVGTCLAEQRPITVHCDQHFRTRYTRLTCTVSPLFDAMGRLAGALDISAYRPDSTGRILPLAQAVTRGAARRIEEHCFRDAYANAVIVSLSEAEEGVSVPLLALDAERRIVGATRAARERLAIDDSALAAGVGMPDPSGNGGATPEAFAKAMRTVLADALSLTQGNVAAAARSLGISRATMHRKIRSLGLDTRQAQASSPLP